MSFILVKVNIFRNSGDKLVARAEGSGPSLGLFVLSSTAILWIARSCVLFIAEISPMMCSICASEFFISWYMRNMENAEMSEIRIEKMQSHFNGADMARVGNDCQQMGARRAIAGGGQVGYVKYRHGTRVSAIEEPKTIFKEITLVYSSGQSKSNEDNELWSLAESSLMSDKLIVLLLLLPERENVGRQSLYRSQTSATTIFAQDEEELGSPRLPYPHLKQSMNGRHVASEKRGVDMWNLFWPS